VEEKKSFFPDVTTAASERGKKAVTQAEAVDHKTA
jgi:hypothetical protein